MFGGLQQRVGLALESASDVMRLGSGSFERLDVIVRLGLKLRARLADLIARGFGGARHLGTLLAE